MATNRSLLLFGLGDGGGGPMASHLEQLDRLKRCKGVPRIHSNITPEEFFENISSDFSSCSERGYPPPPVWVGELYLELHQGSLTSQALLKKQNRYCENRLRGVEALCVYCWRIYCMLPPCLSVPDDWNFAQLRSWTLEIEGLWKETLLNQFHDVLRKCCLCKQFNRPRLRLKAI